MDNVIGQSVFRIIQILDQAHKDWWLRLSMKGAPLTTRKSLISEANKLAEDASVEEYNDTIVLVPVGSILEETWQKLFMADWTQRMLCVPFGQVENILEPYNAPHRVLFFTRNPPFTISATGKSSREEDSKSVTLYVVPDSKEKHTKVPKEKFGFWVGMLIYTLLSRCKHGNGYTIGNNNLYASMEEWVDDNQNIHNVSAVHEKEFESMAKKAFDEINLVPPRVISQDIIPWYPGVAGV